MDANTVQAMVQKAMEGADVMVEGAGANYDITVVSDVFESLRPVRRQQLVYGALNAAIADGSIHAVNIRTYTATEWEARGA